MTGKGKSHYEIGMGLVRKAYLSKNKSSFKRFLGKAVEHIRRAAYLGNVNAQFELGQKYEDTGFFGENPKRALYWYLKAAEKGHAEACNCIGFYHDHGIGVKKNPQKAITWYKKGANRGSKLARKTWQKVCKGNFHVLGLRYCLLTIPPA